MSAAARLMMPKARISGTGIVSVPMRKFCSERAVCAPQYLSAGTSSGPKESVSVRVLVIAGSCLRGLASCRMFLIPARGAQGG